jgi:cytoskeletal protein CcmA (bactofilin family)
MARRRQAGFAVFATCMGVLLADAAALADDPEPAAADSSDSGSFLAGEEVVTQGDVGGSSVLAGGRVESTANVHGNAVLLGGAVRVTGATSEDVYAAGGDVSIDGRVGRNLRVAGGQVVVSPTAEVLGDVGIAGGHVVIEGRVAGDINLAGGRVRLNGPVGGDVDVHAGQLEIGPAARIEGRVQYETQQAPQIDPAAAIKGGAEAKPKHWYGHRLGRRAGIGGPGWFGLLVVGTIMILASPALGGRLLTHLKTRSGAVVGWGLLCLFATPIALVLCAITIIGIPLAIVLLLAYLLALLVGYASGLVALGQWGLARLSPARASGAGWQILALIVAIIAVGILRRLPFLGGLVGFAVVVLGIGVLALELSRSMRSSAPRTGTAS